LTILTILASYKIAYIIGEKYYFDKIFYKKSFAHGYYQNAKPKSKWWFYRIFNYKHRSDDLITLFGVKPKLNIFENIINVISNYSTDKNYFKVALIGDSMFFGTGIKNNETLSHYLEIELNNFRESKVYNFSYFGDDLLDNYSKYLLSKKYYKPDIYIFALVANDLTFNSLNRYPNKKDLYNQLTTQCKQIDTFWSPIPYPDDWEEQTLLLNYPSFQNNYKNICVLEELSKNINYENVIFVDYECQYNLFEDCIKEYDLAHQQNCEIMSTYNYTYFPKSVTRVNTCNTRYYTVSKTEGHPSKEMNQLLAKEILNKILINNIGKFYGQ